MTQPPRVADWPALEGPSVLLAPALLDWASRTDPACPRVCLVTGGRGSGKSHLLAWLLAGSHQHPATTVHATVPAQGHIAVTMAWEIGRQLGYGPTGPEELLARVEADPRPLRMIVPDLHLSGRGSGDLPSATPQAVVTDLLGPLLSLPGVRAAIEVDRAELLPPEFQPLVLALPPGGPPFRRRAFASASVAASTAAVPQDAAPPAPGADWQAASATARETALDLALRQGAASRLLMDPGYLAYGSPVAITAALADTRIAVPRSLRTVWASAGPALSSTELLDPERVAVLHTAAVAVDPRLAEFLRPRAEQHSWTARWSRPGLRTAGLALAEGAPTEGALLAADLIGRLHRHDPADGSLTGRITTEPSLRPVHIAAVDPEHLITLDATGHLRLVPVSETGSAGAQDPAPAGLHAFVQEHNASVLARGNPPVTAVAADRGTVVIADADGSFHLWQVGSRTAAAGHTHRPHQVPVTALSCLALPEVRDGLVLVFTGAGDGTVRLWDSASGRSMPEPIERRNALPTALASVNTPTGPALAVAWSDRRLHLWRPTQGRMTPLPLVQHTDALALTPDGLLICGGNQGTVALELDLDAL
ncbi:MULTISPECIES: hypothetical protein [Streptacidiphilus]|uniref:WD40 repeat domain-containing protein n=1 Tax=Streptacidiphilus cavernicola TaxID=3342716 RepID=A0ABV6UHK0_9ACTN|nr:hypothetical protein [Streptacidiphilus jeojiense]